MRWFQLSRHELKYYKESTSKEPIRSLDLTFCEGVASSHELGKPNCFCVKMPARTYYMYAASPEDAQSWIDAIQAKMVSGTVALSRCRCLQHMLVGSPRSPATIRRPRARQH